MASKKKKDELANLEKDLLLDPEKVKRRKRKKRHRLAIAVVCELAVLTAIVATAFQILRMVGKSSLQSKAESARPELVPVVAQDAMTEEEKERWQEGWVKYQDTVYAYNEDIRTFLFMGIDKDSDVQKVEGIIGGGQADALFLAVMNPHDEKIRIIGINRNTMTDIDIYNEEGAYVTTAKAQIAVQHGFGNGMEESCEYEKKAVSKLFYGLPIHGYAAINMSAIPIINDAVGGVDVTVLEDLTAKDGALKEGEQVHLMGESAFWYVKYRDTDSFGSADGRLARQKQYLNGWIRSARQAAKEDITVALELYQAVMPMMITDISLNEAAYLAPVLLDYQFDSEGFYMMEGETVMGEQFEEFYADEEALYEMILEVFYEKVEDIQ